MHVKKSIQLIKLYEHANSYTNSENGTQYEHRANVLFVNKNKVFISKFICAI